MEVCQAIRARRSIRRFLPREVPHEALAELADLARLYASGGNMQPMKLAIVEKEEHREMVFSCLKWAMYLKDFTIRPDQRPMAYLVLIGDKRIRSQYGFDLGAMATNVMLGAQEFGLASCCLAIVEKDPIRKLLGLHAQQEPEVVIALGYADQQSEAVAFVDTPAYAQLPNGDLQVPKRSLAEICVENHCKTEVL